MSQLSRIDIAEALASAWSEASISFAVVHGLEKYPQAFGRDLDILIHSNSIPFALQTAKAALEKMRCRLMVHRRFNGDCWCFVKIPDSPKLFEFDLISMLRWGPCALHTAPETTGNQGPFPVDLIASFTKSVLLPLVGGNPKRAIDRMTEVSMLEVNKKRIFDFLFPRLGEQLSLLVWKGLCEGDAEKLKRLVPQIKIRLLKCGIQSRPWVLFLAIRHWLMNKLSTSAISTSLAPSIAFVGPDGVGKSTVITLVAKKIRDQLPFNAVHLRHWRPNLIPPLAKIIGRQAPTAGAANPPRRKPGRFPLIRLVYYGFDFIVGSWLKDKPRLAFNELVIYDRCVLDMMVDPVRFGLRGIKGIEIIHKLGRQYDLVVLLKDTPKRIFSRKPELSIEEIKTQYDSWEKLYQRGMIHAIVDVESGPEAASEHITTLVQSVAVSRLCFVTHTK
jgi:thymidylate kinase